MLKAGILINTMAQPSSKLSVILLKRKDGIKMTKKYRVSIEVDEEWVKNFDLVFDAEDEEEACNEAMMQVKMNLGDYITAYADEEEN
tara:strand:+ start:366 stop:626 length:261 start_codon:yes stop_codon:yes gene_type:complete